MACTSASEDPVADRAGDLGVNRDLQIGLAVAVHVALHMGQNAVGRWHQLEPELAGGAAEGVIANEAEGLVPCRTGVSVDLPDVDHIQAFDKVGDQVPRVEAGATVGQIVEVEGVCTRAAGQEVAAFAADQEIVAAFAEELVGALEATQDIEVVVTEEPVTKGRAGQTLELEKRFEVCLPSTNAWSVASDACTAVAEVA
jgi:hypothetical protein